MEKIYSERPNACKIVKARPTTIQFLLDYSKSLEVTDYNGIIFESNKN